MICHLRPSTNNLFFRLSFLRCDDASVAVVAIVTVVGVAPGKGRKEFRNSSLFQIFGTFPIGYTKISQHMHTHTY